MIAYFDASALVKLFLDEPGRDLLERSWDAFGARVTSVASYPEARSALAGAARAGRMRAEVHEAAVGDLGSLLAEMSIVELGVALAQEAGELAERFMLRGYDAVHLASALSVDDDATTVVVTWDTELARAAVSAGLSVVPT